MSRSMFENTETAFKLKDNYSLYNAKLLFNVITKKYLVNFLTTLTLFSLKYKLPVKWILKKTLSPCQWDQTPPFFAEPSLKGPRKGTRRANGTPSTYVRTCTL